MEAWPPRSPGLADLARVELCRWGQAGPARWKEGWCGTGVTQSGGGWGYQASDVTSKHRLSSPPGVLLDIQQHFGVKDRGAGLLQSGEASTPAWPCPSFLGGHSLLGLRFVYRSHCCHSQRPPPPPASASLLAKEIKLPRPCPERPWEAQCRPRAQVPAGGSQVPAGGSGASGDPGLQVSSGGLKGAP